jgi:dihydrodipicolinate reductase
MKKMYVKAFKAKTFPQATRVLISTNISITTIMLVQFSHKNSKSLEI